MRFTTTLLSLLLVHLCFSQTLKQTIPHFGLLGAKQLGTHAVLLSTSERNEVNLTSISNDGSTLWQNTLAIATLSGYHFNKVQLVGNDSLIFLIQQQPRVTVITRLDAITGSILQSKNLKLKTGENAKVWGLEGSTVSMLTSQEGVLLKHTLQDDGSLEVVKVLDMPAKYAANKYKVHFAKQNTAYMTTRVLAPNHGLIHLYLAKYNLETGDTLENEIDLELANTSFTYNSSVDKRVFGMVPSEDGFYLVGKLDQAFENKYPTAKVGDNFIGFWIAKFNDKLELVYFSEIPFQYLDHIVPSDIIQKPTVIDINEDANGGVFINLNELQGIIYGKKYFVYLNNLGELGVAKGGADEYHFMEYDRMGLRDVGRKSRLRFISDDWTQYGTDPFLYFTVQEELFSAQANNVINLASNSDTYLPTEKNFTYFVLGGKTVYFEYQSKKKGNLNVYTD